MAQSHSVRRHQTRVEILSQPRVLVLERFLFVHSDICIALVKDA